LLIVFPTASAEENFDWTMRRPTEYTPILERVENLYSDGTAAVGLGVNITEYIENSPSFGGFDVVWFRITATGNTREIISYGVSTTTYMWYEVSNPTYIDEDDESVWISFSTSVRFYGGRKSAEYTGVYVCSNGFISFDSDATDKYYVKITNKIKSISKHY
jgi:hypothetical protein